MSAVGSQETASTQPGPSRLLIPPVAVIECNNGSVSSDVGVPSLSPSPRSEVSSPLALARISAEKTVAASKSSFALAAAVPSTSSVVLPSSHLEHMLSQNQSNACHAASAPETEDGGGSDSQQLRYLLQRGEDEPKSQTGTATSTTASASPRPQEQLGVATGVGVPGARETLRDKRDSVWQTFDV